MRIGSGRSTSTKWRNPASPDVLRALPWEFGDDVFTPSTPPAPQKQELASSKNAPINSPSNPSEPAPEPTAPSDSFRPTNRPASMPNPQDIPTPETLPRTPLSKADILMNDPLYRHLLKVKPTTLPEVFVKDSEAFNRSGMEAMLSSRGEIVDPASLSRRELLRLVGNKSSLSPTDLSKGPKGSMSASPLSYPSRTSPSLSAKDKEKARARAKNQERERASMMDETEAKFAVMPVAAAMIEQAKEEERAAAARTSNVSTIAASSTPWRAKSSPELAASSNSRGSVRFQVDAAFNAIRPRRSSSKVSTSFDEPTPPLPPLRPVSPPSIPPLDIPQVSSFTGAAEDILRQSLETSVGHEIQPHLADDARERQNSAILKAAEEMRASRNTLMEMDAAQTIEWIIQSSAKKKQEYAPVSQIGSIKLLTDVL